MNAVADINDYRWLTSAGAAEWLTRAAAEAADRSQSTVQRTAELRRHLSPARAHLVLEQADLRVRGVRKFAAAERMFFTRVGLEQATDEIVAGYKAGRFPAGAAVADLCCGIGGDLLALAARGLAIGVDRDPIAALFAAANLRAAALSNGGNLDAVVVADVETLDVAHFGAWHIDPDRRPQGRRTTRAELHEPGPATVDRLRAACPAGAVKLAPAATLPASWELEAELEWISRGGECRQLVAWFGTLAHAAGLRRATVLDRSCEQPRTIVGRVSNESPTADCSLPTTKTFGAYLLEPDVAVLAAGLTAALAAEHGLSAITPGIAYLTGEQPIADPALACFVVREVLPFDLRKLRGALRQRRIGRLEIKKRGVPCDLEKLRRDLRLTGEEQATLIVLPVNGHPVAVLAARLEDNTREHLPHRAMTKDEGMNV